MKAKVIGKSWRVTHNICLTVKLWRSTLVLILGKKMANRIYLSLLQNGEEWNNKVDLDPNFKADLSDADLSGQDFSYRNFTGANLANVNFNKCNLTGANFEKANLVGAKFWQKFYLISHYQK
ncbi:pentapeptide repeat-containing protein [Nostoc cycadae]|uniref:Pentapeptide repeat-containing protein n=1 Tax=Nostoc cycadae WK-1 TaxID=1861711 RepID=A0A2H6LE66_9NOSO|nr:pentapeptide repeat-containing protein [Nostoc cycadae]GBE91517.1 pentapeptide repeat-containing protein [Nostoc cycadae WK-1]